MLELYVIRHGTTEWNKTRRIQGSSDVPLDDEGRQIARETAEGLKDTHFDICYSSPLSRARETAEIVLAGRDVEIIDDKRLMEMNFGDLEGTMSFETDENGETRRTISFKVGDDRAYPNGESMVDLEERTKEFFNEIVGNPENDGKRILISTHGAAGRAMMLNVWGRESFWHGIIPLNCAVCIVRTQDGKVVDYEQDRIYYDTSVGNYYAELNKIDD